MVAGATCAIAALARGGKLIRTERINDALHKMVGRKRMRCASLDSLEEWGIASTLSTHLQRSLTTKTHVTWRVEDRGRDAINVRIRHRRAARQTQTQFE